MRKIFLLLFWLLLPLESLACDKQGDLFEAQYVWGEGANYIYLCKEKRSYWVSAQARVLKKLEKEYLRLTTKPYEPINIVFIGVLLNEELEGFAADHDGLIRINKLIEVNRNKGKCDPN